PSGRPARTTARTGPPESPCPEQSATRSRRADRGPARHGGSGLADRAWRIGLGGSGPAPPGALTRTTAPFADICRTLYRVIGPQTGTTTARKKIGRAHV